MNVQAPFGFVTGCHAGDKFMVQATLASMRYYCPSVPICLVVDGSFDVTDLERDYGVIVLRISDLPAAPMRALCAGNSQAKLAAMWEGPFEFYVWLDADAIVWGDFTPQIRRDLDFQIFWSEISIPAQAAEAPAWLSQQYFHPEKLKLFDPNFEWRGLAYFCDGAFASRRNAIPFNKWVEVANWRSHQDNPWTRHRSFNNMPKMNYLVHSMAQRGLLKVDMADLQHIWGHHGTAELERDCATAGWRFPKQIQRPRVAHFCGRKPFLFERKSYSRPFTIARLEHQRRHHGELGAWAKLLQEEWPVLLGKLRRRLAKRRLTMLRRLRQIILSVLPLRVRFALRYMAAHKRFSLLLWPSTFTEKNMLRIAKDRRSFQRTCADKMAMRRYVEQKVGSQYLPQLLCQTQDPETIKWPELPDRFVIKASHGSGLIRVIKQFDPADKAGVAQMIETCKAWLAKDYGMHSREWAYVGIPRSILVEEFIESDCLGKDGVPWDFKCFIFDGRCAMVQVDIGRYYDHRRNLYSPRWELFDSGYNDKCLRTEAPLERPACLREVVDLAEKVGAGIDFVRVDIYSTKKGPLVGELTMTPSGGMAQFSNHDLDRYLGSLWKMARFCDE